MTPICANCKHRLTQDAKFHAGIINIGNETHKHYTESALKLCPVEKCGCINPELEP